MSTPAGTARRRGGDSPLLTLAWFAVVLVVIFTTAFWLGRTVGPAPETERPPVAPHVPMEGH
jgi:hypothetical protein